MATASALGYALLTLLHKGPLTGYDLVRRLRMPLGYYWAAQQSQVYPSLAKLEQDGLITHTESQGPGPRPRKTYELTPAGRTALADWLRLGPSWSPPKNELLLKTYGVNAADPVEMAAMYRAEAVRRTESLAIQRGHLANLEAAGASRPGHIDFGNYANVQIGIGNDEMYIKWCEWLASQLEGPASS